MITVKKDAIKIKTSDGMQSVGVLANVGTFGVDNMKFMTQWSNTFYQASFPEETHLVLEYGDAFGGTMLNMFAFGDGLKSIKVVGEKRVGLNANGAFRNIKTLERIDFTECPAVFSILTDTFRESAALKEIIGELDLTNATAVTRAFQYSYGLEEVRFKENSIFLSIQFNYCSLLSDASIQSIIDGLATVETAQTITFHADVKAKLTEEQITTITSKNWTLA